MVESYEKDIQEELDTARRERKIEASLARKEKYKAIGTKRLRALKKLKPSPKTKKELQRMAEKIFMPKKTTTTKSELKAQRAHQIKMAKLRLQQIRAQQEKVSYEQDPRFEKTGAREQFLSEPDPQHEMNVARAQQYQDQYGEEYPYEYSEEQRPSRFRRFLRGVNRLRLKSSSHFELQRERPRSMLAYENKFNRPLGPKGNDKITLMNSTQTNKPVPLQFTTAPRMGLLKGVKDNVENKKWSGPKKVKTW